MHNAQMNLEDVLGSLCEANITKFRCSLEEKEMFTNSGRIKIRTLCVLSAHHIQKSTQNRRRSGKRALHEAPKNHCRKEASTKYLIPTPSGSTHCFQGSKHGCISCWESSNGFLLFPSHTFQNLQSSRKMESSPCDHCCL